MKTVSLVSWIVVCNRALLRNILVLLPLLGITWVFGVIAVNRQLVAFQFIFAIANSLQVCCFFIVKFDPLNV